VNLYRIMADVSAGAEQRNAAPGDRGIATLWVRADSDALAVARGEQILAKRHYGSVGTLNCYVEELANDPLASTTAAEQAADRREESILAGYEAIKQQALAQGDGLHEVWLGGISQQIPRAARRATG
jgi:hypothetical protein